MVDFPPLQTKLFAQQHYPMRASPAVCRPYGEGRLQLEKQKEKRGILNIYTHFMLFKNMGANSKPIMAATTAQSARRCQKWPPDGYHRWWGTLSSLIHLP
jgi:hypothetical protein